MMDPGWGGAQSNSNTNNSTEISREDEENRRASRRQLSV